MRITALGKPFYNYPKSTVMNKRMSISAPNTMGADIFCFTGALKSDKVSIIPATKDTYLSTQIAKKTKIDSTETDVKKFKNGEIYVNINGDMYGKDVYLMPSVNENVNDGLMETYLKADAAKRAGANKVIAIMPSFNYARQEKRTGSGEPLAAKLNMDLLKTAGVDAIITADLHTPALEGFAKNDLHIAHLESMPLVKKYIEQKGIEDLVIVSPDLGGTKRADKLAKSLNCDKAIIYKHRQAHNQATAEDLIGDVEGKNCVIYDDIIDTAGTIAEAAKLLKKKGAKDIYICASHGLFNGDAMKNLQEAPVKEVIVTNSMPKKDNLIDKIKYIDISEQIVDAMEKISDN